MVQGEGLQVLEEGMEAMDHDENEIYKFLGVEQADGIKTRTVFERVKEEVMKRVKMLLKSELNDVNLIASINAIVIPVDAYPMNVCKFSTGELNELNEVIKRELRAKNMLGRQASDERLYLKREQAVAILAQKNWGTRKDWGSEDKAPGKISKTTPFRS